MNFPLVSVHILKLACFEIGHGRHLHSFSTLKTRGMDFLNGRWTESVINPALVENVHGLFLNPVLYKDAPCHL